MLSTNPVPHTTCIRYAQGSSKPYTICTTAIIIASSRTKTRHRILDLAQLLAMSSNPAYTSMEQVFRSGDILQEIFASVKACVNPSVYQSDALPAEALDCQRTLSAASRVCKASHGPASRLLWQDLPSFDPILCMLSSSVRLVTHPANSRPSFHVDGTPALSGGTYWVCTSYRPPRFLS